MNKSISKYIKYLKSSSEEVKFIHAIVFASICTGIFIAVYLFLMRDIGPSTYLLEDKTYVSRPAEI